MYFPWKFAGLNQFLGESEREENYCSFKFFNLGESYGAKSGVWSQDWKQTMKWGSVQRTNTVRGGK